MPIFEYRAIDSKGKKIKGFVDADSIRVARAKLRENGYYPVEVREDVQIGSPRDRVSSRGLAGAINRLLGRVRLQDLSIMTRQLAILVDSGMPVAAALDGAGSPECPLAAEAGRCGYRSMAVLPLLYAGRPYGVVCVYSRTARAFDEGKLRLLGLFAHLAAVAACHGEAAAGAGRIEVGFRDLVDQLPCVAYVVTAAVPPEFLFISSSVESFLGYAPQEFYADPSLTFRIVHPEDRARVEEHMRLGARSLEFLTAEFRVVHRNGRDVYHVVLRSRPLEERAGLLLLRQGILIDVTEQKRLEQELLQSQRLAAIGEMAAMMAHEIRNPLAGMSLALRVLRGARGDRETEDECLDDLAQCLGRINATVSRVLDFSKARPVVLRPCALAAIVEGAQRLTATYLRKSGVTLHVDLAEGLPALVADRDQIEQVIVNLVLNACKAMPEGGVATIRAGATATHVFVEVRDTGCLLYTSPSPRDLSTSRMPSSA